MDNKYSVLVYNIPLNNDEENKRNMEFVDFRKRILERHPAWTVDSKTVLKSKDFEASLWDATKRYHATVVNAHGSEDGCIPFKIGRELSSHGTEGGEWGYWILNAANLDGHAAFSPGDNRPTLIRFLHNGINNKVALIGCYSAGIVGDAPGFRKLPFQPTWSNVKINSQTREIEAAEHLELTDLCDSIIVTGFTLNLSVKALCYTTCTVGCKW